MSSIAQPIGLLPVRSCTSTDSPTLPLRKLSTPALQTAKKPEEGLTRKRKLFVEFHLRGLSDKEAALKAGYAASYAENAWQIRQNPAVAAEIRRRMSEHFRQHELTTDEIIDRTRRIAEANVLDYVDVQPDGGFKVNLSKVSREQAEAIEELSTDAYGRAKLRLVSKLSANDQLARFKKMYADDADKSGGRDGGPLTIQSLDSIVKNYIQQNVVVNVHSTQLPERKQVQGHQTIEAKAELTA